MSTQAIDTGHLALVRGFDPARGSQQGSRYTVIRRLTTLFALILAMGFSSTSAQDAPPVDLSGLDGLETAYGRMYFQGAMATPTTDDTERTPLFGLATILTFNDPESAMAGFEALDEEFSTGFFGTSDEDVEREEIGDLGDRAVEFTDAFTLDTAPAEPATIVLVHDDDTVLFSVMVSGPDTSEWAHSFAEHMLEDEDGADEIVFSEDGTSTGGPFDRMPTMDEMTVPGGLIPYLDIDYLASTAE